MATHLSPEEIREVLEENKDLKKKLIEITSQSDNSRERVINTSKKAARLWAGSNLNTSFDRVYDELPMVTKSAFAQLSASIIKRLTRVGFFAVLFAVIPAFLLVIQTYILYQQNQKIQKQVYLEEANRRNNLVFLMDNVLDIVHDEVGGASSSNLTKSTTARIKSLMYGFRPYKFLDGEELTKPLSPEKGQFLLALINSGISKTSMKSIYNASFNNVYLKDANMFGAFLETADMPSSDLEGVDLYSANLKDANLYDVNLQNTQLGKADLTNADLRSADLRYANLAGATLSGAFLEDANFEGTNLTGASLEGAHVGSSNWLDDLDNWYVIGADDIENAYTLDGPHTNEYDTDYYIIEAKNNRKKK